MANPSDPHDTSSSTPPFPTSGQSSASSTGSGSGSTGSGTGSTGSGTGSGSTGSGSTGSGSGNGSNSGSGARSGVDMLGKVVQGAHRAIDRFAEQAAPRVERLQAGIHQAGDSLHQRSAQARETGDEWAESVRCTVRESPLVSIGTAFAIGFLIARLTR